MDLNSVTDTLSVRELLCDAAVEQPIEGEFNIPDYQPEIFKIIKTKAEPVIVQKIAAGARATVDGYVRLTVLYQSQEDSRVCATTQKLPFSRQFELSAPVGDSNELYCRAGIGFLNCRAVNSRKIDARGTVELELKAVSQYPCEAVSALEGEGAQQQKNDLVLIREITCEEKQFTLEETLAVDYEDCDMPVLLRCDAGAVSDSVMIENGRAIVAGNVNLQLAFDLSNEQEYRIKRVGFNLPFNQVLDLSLEEGEYQATAEVSVLACSAAVAEDGNAEANVTCSIELRVSQSREASVLTDAFSTKTGLSIARRLVAGYSQVNEINESFGVRFSFENQTGTLIDFFILNNSCAVTEGSINGKATLCCLFCDETGEISAVEQDFEYAVVRAGSGVGYGEVNALFTLLECVQSAGVINVKCEGVLYGRFCEISRIEIVREVKSDPSAISTKTDAALVVYYADPDESVWEIAKRFNTAPDEISQEYAQQGENGEPPLFMLIPIVG